MHLSNEVVLYILLSRNNYDDNGETLILTRRFLKTPFHSDIL